MNEKEIKETIKKEMETVLGNIKGRMGKLTEISQTMLTEAEGRVKSELSTLEDKWQSAYHSLEKISASTEETWQEITSSVEETWEDLSQHFGKVINQFKKEGISFRDKWELYQDSSHHWRWRRRDLDEQIVGSSHTGFKTRQECVENAQRHGYESH